MAGWERVLADVVRERRADLLAYAALCTTTRAETEAVLREALVRAFSGRRRPRSTDDAVQAVRAAVRTVCAARAGARSIARPDVSAASGTARLLVDTRAALAALTPLQRLCVVAHHVDDLPVARIAEDLRTSEATVRRELAAGATELRRLVGACMERAVEEMRVAALVPCVPSQGKAS